MFHQLQFRSYGIGERAQLYNAARGNLGFIQRLKLDKKLEVHNGCVNSISWNERGTSLLSGSDDQYLVVSNPYSGKILHKIHSGHRANIFGAKFMSRCLDSETVSCSGDGKIFYTLLEREDTYGKFLFDCHFGTTYEVLVIPSEASTFLSCGEDGTVRFFDLRVKMSCTKHSCKDDVMITCSNAVTAIDTNPLLPWQLVAGCADSSVRIYDRRMLGTKITGNCAGKGISGLLSCFTPSSMENQSYRVTSLTYSSDGKEVLVSYSSEYIYLLGTYGTDPIKQLSKELPMTEENIPTSCQEQMTTFEHVPRSEPTPSTSLSIHNDLVHDSVPRPPPVKRLRLRGDWSDTGPRARPECELYDGSHAENQGQQGAARPRPTIMNRMSNMLTRWLHGSIQQNQGQGAADSPQEQSVAELPNSNELMLQSPSDESGVLSAQSMPQYVEDGNSPEHMVADLQNATMTTPALVGFQTFEPGHDVEKSGSDSTDIPPSTLLYKTDNMALEDIRSANGSTSEVEMTHVSKSIHTGKLYNDNQFFETWNLVPSKMSCSVGSDVMCNNILQNDPCTKYSEENENDRCTKYNKEIGNDLFKDLSDCNSSDFCDKKFSNPLEYTLYRENIPVEGNLTIQCLQGDETFQYNDKKHKLGLNEGSKEIAMSTVESILATECSVPCTEISECVEVSMDCNGPIGSAMSETIAIGECETQTLKSIKEGSVAGHCHISVETSSSNVQVFNKFWNLEDKILQPSEISFTNRSSDALINFSDIVKSKTSPLQVSDNVKEEEWVEMENVKDLKESGDETKITLQPWIQTNCAVLTVSEAFDCDNNDTEMILSQYTVQQDRNIDMSLDCNNIDMSFNQDDSRFVNSIVDWKQEETGLSVDLPRVNIDLLENQESGTVGTCAMVVKLDSHNHEGRSDYKCTQSSVSEDMTLSALKVHRNPLINKPLIDSGAMSLESSCIDSLFTKSEEIVRKDLHTSSASINTKTGSSDMKDLTIFLTEVGTSCTVCTGTEIVCSITEIQQVLEGTTTTDNQDVLKGTSITDNQEVLEGTSKMDNQEVLEGTSKTDNQEVLEGTSVTDIQEVLEGTSKTDNQEVLERTSKTDNQEVFEVTSKTDNQEVLEGSSIRDNQQVLQGTSPDASQYFNLVSASATQDSNIEPVPATRVSNPEYGVGVGHSFFGHIEQPTVHFQQLVDNNSSVHDNVSDDVDGEAAAVSSGGHDDENRRSSMERTKAALKIQAFHRMHKEMKEKKEMQKKNVVGLNIQRVYKGHRNARTMIKESNFWGSQYVLSGSDCGHVFIWDRDTAKVVMLLEGDKHVVNCVQPHPFDMLLATSGIDHDIKIWSPLSQQECFNEQRAIEVMKRNEIMLDETRDTITVPAAFMLRVLASINNIRSGRHSVPERNSSLQDQQNDTE